jgi:hypothetical protein
LKEEYGLRVFEDKLLRKIFGPKRQEDKKLDTEETVWSCELDSKWLMMGFSGGVF